MSDTLINRLQSLDVIKAMTLGDCVFSVEDKTLIEEAYQSLLHRSVRRCNCRSRYADALVELLSQIKKANNMNKYILKAGALIWLGDDCYTRNNITDDVAKRYLELHPDATRHFETIPTVETPTEEVKEPTPEAKPKKSKKKGE